MKRYQKARRQLAEEGMTFRPMVWRTEGMPHPVVLRVLGYAVEIAARKNMDLDRKAFVRRWSREFSV